MSLDDALATLAVEFEGAQIADGVLHYTRGDPCGSWDDGLDADDVRELIAALTVVLAAMEDGR